MLALRVLNGPGLGAARTVDEYKTLINQWYSSHEGNPTTSDVTVFLGSFNGAERDQVVQLLLVGGLATSLISRALLDLTPYTPPWYMNWKYLVPIGLGVVGLSIGGYFVFRKKRR